MYRNFHHAVWLTALSAGVSMTPQLVAAARAAEQANLSAQATATDARANVPAAKYDSAFTGYRPYREQALAPWRALNDDVHQAGGHIGIFGNAPGNRTTPAPTTSTQPTENKK